MVEKNVQMSGPIFEKIDACLQSAIFIELEVNTYMKHVLNRMHILVDPVDDFCDFHKKR